MTLLEGGIKVLGYSKEQQLGNSVKKKSQTERNLSANEKLDKIYKEKGLFNICEVKVTNNCLKKSKVSSVGTKLGMTYAHRHKRDWYKPKDKRPLLHAFTETLRCCLPCHMKIETDRKLTFKLFTEIRGTQLTRMTDKKETNHASI